MTLKSLFKIFLCVIENFLVNFSIFNCGCSSRSPPVTSSVRPYPLCVFVPKLCFCNCWQLFTVCGNFCQLLATFGSFWQLLPTFGNFWQLLATFGNFWQLLANVGHCWQLLATFGNCWQVLATFETFGNF